MVVIKYLNNQKLSEFIRSKTKVKFFCCLMNSIAKLNQEFLNVKEKVFEMKQNFHKNLKCS